MATTEPKGTPPGRYLFPIMLVCVGVVMIGLSFLTPSLSLERSAWSDQQALQYQASAANFHRLSHEIADASPGKEAEAAQRELEAAQADYRQLRAELDAARRLPGRITLILRLLGVALAIAGTAVAIVDRQA